MRIKNIKKVMFKLLTIILLCFSLNLNSQSVVCHPMSSDEECLLVVLALNEFIEDTNVTVIFNGITPLYPAFEGITWQYHQNLYEININIIDMDEVDRRWTILHEVGHVIDLYYRNLTQFPLTWKGKPIEQNIPWEDRPWEKSADKWANRLWKRLFDDDPPYHIHMEKINKINEKPSCLKY
jgi:hypothetical protein